MTWFPAFALAIAVAMMGFGVLGLQERVTALEKPNGTVTIVVPRDLRKLRCVPMQYLLSNRRISEIHSYSTDLKICKGR